MKVQTVSGREETMLKTILKGTAFIVTPFILIGCTTEKMDAPPSDIVEEIEWESFSEEESQESEEGEQDEAVAEGVERELYLLDEEGVVVPFKLALPREEGALKQTLEYLVKDGPITPFLPNGLQPVLPPGTEVDVHLTEDGTAIADFSPEFKEYDPKYEQSILQAITWTLTQFDNVDNVQIRMNGHEQEVMPLEETPIGKSYSRENGINLESGDVTDMTASNSVTVYFLSHIDGEPYYVPVTRRVVVEDKEDQLAKTMEELLKGPAVDSSFEHIFNEGIKVEESTISDEETASLSFNDAILTEKDGTAISEEALQVISRSATAIEGIEQVDIKVDGLEDVISVSSGSLEDAESAEEQDHEVDEEEMVK